MQRRRIWTSIHTAGRLARLAAARRARQGRGAVLQAVRHAHAAVQRFRTRRPSAADAMVRVSLRTRVLLVLISVAAVSTTISAILQDRSLVRDLEAAGRVRIESSAALVQQIVQTSLAAQLDRCRAIASTPQFLANLEANHAPTLAQYAAELVDGLGAAAVSFLAPDGCETAGTGEAGLRQALTQRPNGANVTAASGLLSHADQLFAVATVPLRERTRLFGTLVVVSRVDEPLLAAWSRLCRARVSLARATDPPASALPACTAGDLELRVAVDFDAEQEALANSRFSLFAGGLLGLALASVAAFVLAASLVRPICAIQAATRRIALGDFDFALDERRGDEVGDVARGFNLMLQNLRQNIDHRVRVEHEIRHQARHDGLTGLGNRRLLMDRLTAALASARLNEGRVGVLLVGLDRFKDVNDTIGHTAGDDLLVEVATRLRAWADNTAGTDLATGTAPELVRHGGDEFALVLPRVGGREELAAIAQDVLRRLGGEYVVRGRRLSLTASLGLALAPEDATEAEALLCGADLAMHSAKAQGGGRFACYADSMQAEVARRLALDNELRQALAKGEFQLHYQPKLDLATGQLTGVEALLRWVSSAHGVIGPGEFIPRLEETGAILPIGAWVLETAVRQAVEWQRLRPTLPPSVAVNVSVRQIEQGEEFVALVQSLLAATGLEPALLELEITEGVLLRDPDAAVAVLERLRALGVRLALDDFGTGYSSLSQLRRLPFDTLKIDRSFVTDLEEDPDGAAMVAAIVAIARVVDLRVVVEGVETEAQRRLVERLGGDEVQGYLVGPPAGADETTELLLAKRRRRAGRRATARRATR